MAPRRARDGALGAGQGGLMEFPFAIAFVISGYFFACVFNKNRQFIISQFS